MTNPFESDFDPYEQLIECINQTNYNSRILNQLVRQHQSSANYVETLTAHYKTAIDLIEYQKVEMDAMSRRIRELEYAIKQTPK